MFEALLGCFRGGMPGALHSRSLPAQSRKKLQNEAETVTSPLQIYESQAGAITQQIPTPYLPTEAAPSSSLQQQEQQLACIVTAALHLGADDATTRLFLRSSTASTSQLLPPRTQARKHGASECVQRPFSSFDFSDRPSTSTLTASSFASAQAELLDWQSACSSQPRGSKADDPRLAFQRPSLTAPERTDASAAAADDGWGYLDPATCSWDRSFCSGTSTSFSDPYTYGRMISDDDLTCT